MSTSCPNCGYDLVGIGWKELCPECGLDYDDAWEKRHPSSYSLRALLITQVPGSAASFLIFQRTVSQLRTPLVDTEALFDDLIWQATLIVSTTCLLSTIPTLISLVRRRKRVGRNWFVCATLIGALSTGTGITVLAGQIQFGA